MTQPMVEAGRKTGTSKPPTAGFRFKAFLAPLVELRVGGLRESNARLAEAPKLVPAISRPLHGHRVAISNSRLDAHPVLKVASACQMTRITASSGPERYKTMRLATPSSSRRFLLHEVLPVASTVFGITGFWPMAAASGNIASRPTRPRTVLAMAGKDTRAVRRGPRRTAAVSCRGHAHAPASA